MIISAYLRKTNQALHFKPTIGFMILAFFWDMFSENSYSYCEKDARNIKLSTVELKAAFRKNPIWSFQSWECSNWDLRARSLSGKFPNFEVSKQNTDLDGSSITYVLVEFTHPYSSLKSWKLSWNSNNCHKSRKKIL